MAVLLAGLVLLWLATGGGQSFTTETLRRQQVMAQPQSIDTFAVTTSSGKKTSLNDLLAAGNKVWLIDFVYTRCKTVCSSLGSIYQQLQAEIEARGLQDKVGLLSISFDPANDNAPAVAAYAKRMRMNPAIWQIATLSNWKDRRRLLDAFGIMVVPAPLGEFEHNAALHVVTSDAKLVRIIDYLNSATALDTAVAINKRGTNPLQHDLSAAQ
jgi:protein SCO1/2